MQCSNLLQAIQQQQQKKKKKKKKNKSCSCCNLYAQVGCQSGGFEHVDLSVVAQQADPALRIPLRPLRALPAETAAGTAGKGSGAKDGCKQFGTVSCYSSCNSLDTAGDTTEILSAQLHIDDMHCFGCIAEK
jgi:hypothetical protein